MRKHFLPILLSLIIGCSSDSDNNSINNANEDYFPPNNTSEWATLSLNELNWNPQAIDELNTFLEENNTKAFLILKNGKIAYEKYFGTFSSNQSHPWNSAGKTLVSATVGIAQEQEYFTIQDRVSDYLGTSWTNVPPEKESLIHIEHLLAMTSGIDDEHQYIIPSNLNYMADAGNRWAYGNVFQVLTQVVSQASNQDFEAYFNSNLKQKIGMSGFWNFGPIYTIFHSNARSMARFGLLAQHYGRWKTEQIIPENYFIQSVNSSQNINPSYGYLWWLNGKNSYMLPSTQQVFNGSLIPNAPAEMFQAMGAKEQRIYVVKSEKLVIVRLGDAANSSGGNQALSNFDALLWEKINRVILQ